MFEKIIKDYFSFSRKERVAVIILVVMIFIFVLLPHFFPEQSPGKMEFKNLKSEAAKSQADKEDKDIPDNPTNTYSHQRERSFKSPPFEDEKSPVKSALFYFDPNSLSGDGWKKLGLRDKTIAIIHNYISKGGKFKYKEDIGKIYGLHPDEVKRLMPYVKIISDEKPVVVEKSRPVQSANEFKDYHPRSKESFTGVIDLNKADSTELMQLPGIGVKLASRILRFRDKLGGFYAVDQLSEVYALPDSTFQKIKGRLAITNSLAPSININTIDANNLKQHPYIRWNLASAIVEYRTQHGNYERLEDLHKVALVTEEIYRKIVPYLKLQ